MKMDKSQQTHRNIKDQRKYYHVHRFLIKATIEERMQAMLKTAERR